MQNNLKIAQNQIKKRKTKKYNFQRKPSNRYISITMKADEIKKILEKRITEKNLLKKENIKYPKYLYSIINTCNQLSGATNSRNIGKLHSRFQERKFRNLGEWKNNYNKNNPKAVNNAINTIYNTLEKVIITPENLIIIDKKAKKYYKKYIRNFVENLIFNQTFTGLKIQEAILIKIAQLNKKQYRWSNKKEDSSGIDGFVNNIPYSIKPNSCKIKKKAGVKRIYYKINEKNKTLSFTMSF